jgi:hypothetical protein
MASALALSNKIVITVELQFELGRKRVGSMIETRQKGEFEPGTDSGFARSMGKKTSQHQATLRAGGRGKGGGGGEG